MPRKLIVLVVWMIVGAVLTGVQALLGGSVAGWFSVVCALTRAGRDSTMRPGACGPAGEHGRTRSRRR